MPIVFVTAPEAVTRLPFQGGAIDVKPIDLDVLRSTAGQVLAPLRDGAQATEWGRPPHAG